LREGPGTHEEARPISTPQHTDGHPWCAEHDPSGTCLGDIRTLSRDGAAWLEADGDGAAVVLALARPDGHRPPRLPRLSAAEARELAAALTELADQLDRSTR
jgi:hypothetical protein